MGIFDFLTNSSAPPTVTTGGTSQTSLPPWYEDYQRNLLATGVAAAQEPFQVYGGPRIADFSAKQKEAFEGEAELGREWSPLSTLAAEATTRGAGAFDPAEFEKYMNPYTEGVTEVIGDRGMQRWNEEILPGVTNTFTGGGQFGSRRNMDFTTNAARDIQREIADEQTMALERGFGTALQGYGAGQSRALAGGQQAGTMALGGLSALEGAGAKEQGLTQQSLNLAKTDFDEQRDFPWEQIAKLKGLSTGVVAPQSTVSTQTGVAPGGQPGPSPLEILAGVYGIGSQEEWW